MYGGPLVTLWRDIFSWVFLSLHARFYCSQSFPSIIIARQSFLSVTIARQNFPSVTIARQNFPSVSIARQSFPSITIARQASRVLVLLGKASRALLLLGKASRAFWEKYYPQYINMLTLTSIRILKRVQWILCKIKIEKKKFFLVIGKTSNL